MMQAANSSTLSERRNWRANKGDARSIATQGVAGGKGGEKKKKKNGRIHPISLIQPLRFPWKKVRETKEKSGYTGKKKKEKKKGAVRIIISILPSRKKTISLYQEDP